MAEGRYITPTGRNEAMRSLAVADSVGTALRGVPGMSTVVWTETDGDDCRGWRAGSAQRPIPTGSHLCRDRPPWRSGDVYGGLDRNGWG